MKSTALVAGTTVEHLELRPDPPKAVEVDSTSILLKAG